MSLESSHVAPLGLGCLVYPACYKYVAPLGLRGIGAIVAYIKLKSQKGLVGTVSNCADAVRLNED